MSESSFQAQPGIQSLIYFSRKAAARASRFDTFFDITFAEIGGPNCIKLWETIQSSSMLLKFVLDVRYVLELQCLKI